MCCVRRNLISWVLIILCFSPAALASPAELQSIRIKGNSAISTREILSWLSVRSGTPYSAAVLQNDLKVITQNLRRQGYLGAKSALSAIEYTADSAYVAVTVDVKEGRRSIIGSIRCSGQRELSQPEILEQFEARPGDPLDPGVLEQDIDGLLSRYERLGFPLAHCGVENIESHPGPEVDTLSLLLRIDEGERVRIEEIKVAGNHETKASVVVRETRLSPGEFFNPAKVDAIKTRLSRLNIFSSVAEPELYMRNSTGGLLITVQEGNTNTFDGIVGYMPGTTTGQSGYFTGLVSVGMRNLFGTGRKLNVHWQREDRYSQELGFRYLEPWIFGAPVNVGGGFLQRQQDSSYVQRTIEGEAELMLSEELSVGALVRSEDVIPSVDSLHVSSTLRSSTMAVGSNILYDTRNDLYSPTGGARYRIEYSYGRKKFADDPSRVALASTNSEIQRLLLDLDFFLAPFSRQVIAFGVHGYEVRGKEIQESDMFRLGGTKTLRGYRENQFLGSRVAWTNAEYRFLLGRRSFLFGFLDTGYYSRPDDPEDGIPAEDGFKYGYGIGVRTDTPVGYISVSFALGQGDSFSTAKIHVGLINDF
jgi:outer membrane protein insertion porin family